MTKNLPSTTKLAGFLDKMKTTAPAVTKKKSNLTAAAKAPQDARLVIAMDATASRQPSWNAARETMSAMFDQVPEGLSVSLCYYGGSNFFRATPFISEAGPLIAEAARVECFAGTTQIVRTLSYVSSQIAAGGRIGGVVLVGDDFEEMKDEALAEARRLKLLGCPIFAFFEGDSNHGRYIYEQLASESGGAFVPFDSNAPKVLKELLAGIAAYAHGGMKALEQATKALPAAQLLLTQMKK